MASDSNSVGDIIAHNNERVDVAYQVLKELNGGNEPYSANIMPMVRALAKFAGQIKQAYGSSDEGI